MASQRLMTAFIVFMVTIVALYIFDLTIGAVMDKLYLDFSTLLPQLALSGNWNNVALQTLSYWKLLWRAILAIVLAMGIWLVRTAFIDVDYTRPM